MAEPVPSLDINYPPVKRGDTKEVLHGTEIEDPYRWLEDPDSEETKAFVKDQNELFESVMKKCPSRQKVFEKMKKQYNYEKVSCPSIRNGKYYYSRNSGLQNQAVIYMQKGVEGEPQVILDPNTLSQDGTAALGAMALSEDLPDKDTLLAYGVSRSGSDWQTIHVRPAAPSSEPLSDKVEWVKFSGISWLHDCTGFFYSRYPAPQNLKDKDTDEENLKRGSEVAANQGHKIFLHILGTPQEQDLLVYEDVTNPTYTLSHEVTHDGAYLIVCAHDGCKNANTLMVAPLGSTLSDWRQDRAISTAELEAQAQPQQTQRQRSHLYPLTTLVDNFDASYDYLHNLGACFFFETNLRAPRNRVVRCDLGPVLSGTLHSSHSGSGGGGNGGCDITGDAASAWTLEWEEVVPEPQGREVLSSACVASERFLLVTFMADVQHRLEAFALQSGRRLGRVPLPGIGTVQVSARHSEQEAMLKFTSFLCPGSIFRWDLAPLADLLTPEERAGAQYSSGVGGSAPSSSSSSSSDPSNSTSPSEAPTLPAPELFRETLVPGFDPALFETRQLFFTSSDGERVPLFVLCRRGLRLDGTHPALLYGYGGFNISLLPSFSSLRVVLLQHMHMVVAVANLRGGGEYGEEWHQQGVGHRKQQVFDDLFGAAECLFSHGFTHPSRLAIQGGSNGGLLVAACVNQRPELFACGLAQVGVLDMLRFHKFTIGHAWRSDYGDPDVEEDFRAILKYSPLHTVPSPSTLSSSSSSSSSPHFPSLLLATADHDDRVVPLHSFKYISQVQHSLGDSVGREVPLLIRIETKAGHGAGKPTDKVLEEYADLFSFMAWRIGAKWTEEERE